MERELTKALKRLLNCPDLNLDTLEPETVKAIEYAESVLRGDYGTN